MQFKDILLVTCIVVGSVSGLLQTLLFYSMLDAVNAQRPKDQQIPDMMLTWSEMRKYWGTYPWRVRQDFHSLFPGNRLYFWHNVVLAIFFANAFAALIFLISGVL